MPNGGCRAAGIGRQRRLPRRPVWTVARGCADVSTRRIVGLLAALSLIAGCGSANDPDIEALVDARVAELLDDEPAPTDSEALARGCATMLEAIVDDSELAAYWARGVDDAITGGRWGDAGGSYRLSVDTHVRVEGLIRVYETSACAPLLAQVDPSNAAELARGWVGAAEFFAGLRSLCEVHDRLERTVVEC